ncbi:MAG: hypothetical protein OHK0017_01990 [Patescibacteria group bacterium]
MIVFFGGTSSVVAQDSSTLTQALSTEHQTLLAQQTTNQTSPEINSTNTQTERTFYLTWSGGIPREFICQREISSPADVIGNQVLHNLTWVRVLNEQGHEEQVRLIVNYDDSDYFAMYGSFRSAFVNGYSVPRGQIRGANPGTCGIRFRYDPSQIQP